MNSMERLIRQLGLLVLMLAMSLAGCSPEKSGTDDGKYGYLQISLTKDITKGLVEGSTLEKLSDARKIRLSLEYGGSVIEQTLNLDAVSPQAAEFSTVSQSVKLLSGRYRLLSYALYGEYRKGDMAPVLQVVQVDGNHEIIIREGELTIHDLTVQARTFGRFSAEIYRVEPETKAAPTYTEYFSYDDIDSVLLVMNRTVGMVSYSQSMKVKAHSDKSGVPVFRTDSVDLQSGDYRIIHFELFNRRRQFMYAQDTDVEFQIRHFELTSVGVGVQLPETQGILDGIALRQIWESMDGESWSFHDQDGYGSNWLFTLSDGSPRPVSAWTRQTGVILNSEGRVIGLNLGAFNPMGVVPDAIGQLTALERLYLGEHTDEVYYTLQGVGQVVYAMSPYQMSRKTDIRLHRMEIARERTLIRRLAERSELQSALLYNGVVPDDESVKGVRYAQPKVQTGTFDPANRITGISEKIGNLTNLTELYIANTLIEKLPDNISKLVNVTDLELYNNPFTELDGEMFRNMSNLVSVNIDRLFNLSETQLHAALDKMCEYCPRIQLLYMCNLKLTRLPEKLNRLADLRLLDVSFNRIDSIGSLMPMAPIQVMLNHNRLESLPADLFITDDIELFSCTDNRLKEFPVILSNLPGLYSFETVDLSGNRMHGFQSGFSGIRTEKLLMTGNYMGHLPGECGTGVFPTEFARTGSVINYLDVSFNNIDTITNQGLKGIVDLKAFDISKNDLRSIPSAFNSENFPWLTGLDVSHNRFAGFPQNVLNVLSLQQLLISDQGYFRDENETQWVRSMTDWPDYLHLHPSLTNLNMSGNDFRTVTNFPVNLTTLNVKDNPNIRMVVPDYIMYKIRNGLFAFYFDEGQNIVVE